MKSQNNPEVIYEKVQKLNKEVEEYINLMLSLNLGSEWIVDSLGNRCLTIGIKNTDENDFRKTKFGQSIDITYKGWWKSEEVFDVNIGTTGRFSLIEEKDQVGRAQFYIGFGKLLSNKGFQQELRMTLNKYSDNEQELLNQVKE